MASSAPSRILRTTGFPSSYGCLCALLAIMIFAWGTGYKLSLYKPEPAASSAPAKVCTRSSDAAKSAVDHAVDHHDRLSAAALFAALSLAAEPTPQYATNVVRETAAVDRSPLSRAPILYLRPPPHPQRLLD